MDFASLRVNFIVLATVYSIFLPLKRQIFLTKKGFLTNNEREVIVQEKTLTTLFN